MNGEGAKSSIEINTFPLSIQGETFNSLEELEEHFLRQKLGKEAVQERVSEILAPTKPHGISRRGFLFSVLSGAIGATGKFGTIAQGLGAAIEKNGWVNELLGTLTPADKVFILSSNFFPEWSDQYIGGLYFGSPHCPQGPNSPGATIFIRGLLESQVKRGPLDEEYRDSEAYRMCCIELRDRDGVGSAPTAPPDLQRFQHILKDMTPLTLKILKQSFFRLDSELSAFENCLSNLIASCDRSLQYSLEIKELQTMILQIQSGLETLQGSSAAETIQECKEKIKMLKIEIHIMERGLENLEEERSHPHANAIIQDYGEKLQSLQKQLSAYTTSMNTCIEEIRNAGVPISKDSKYPPVEIIKTLKEIFEIGKLFGYIS